MSHLSILALTTLFCFAPAAEPQQVHALAPTAQENCPDPAVVRWHASYEEALAASRVSKKPVLLFQLLGRLDDALC